MSEIWASASPYDYFMGRWSRLIGRLFLEWLSVPSGKKWLDVGCGTGALSESVLAIQSPSELIAIDASEGFVNAAQQRLGDAAHCRIGNAMDLPFQDNRFDFVVSGLVLNFLSEPVEAIREMKRVTSPGGAVAVYVWDYSGKMEFLTYFWDAVVEHDPGALKFHEGKRFPDSSEEGLRRLFDVAGLPNTTIEPLEVETRFKTFDDYWQPFLGGQGPAPTYLLSLTEQDRSKLRNHLHNRLPVQADGTIPLVARVWAAKSAL